MVTINKVENNKRFLPLDISPFKKGFFTANIGFSQLSKILLRAPHSFPNPIIIALAERSTQRKISPLKDHLILKFYKEPENLRNLLYQYFRMLEDGHIEELREVDPVLAGYFERINEKRKKLKMLINELAIFFRKDHLYPSPKAKLSLLKKIHANARVIEDDFPREIINYLTQYKIPMPLELKFHASILHQYFAEYGLFFFLYQPKDGFIKVLRGEIVGDIVYHSQIKEIIRIVDLDDFFGDFPRVIPGPDLNKRYYLFEITEVGTYFYYNLKKALKSQEKSSSFPRLQLIIEAETSPENTSYWKKREALSKEFSLLGINESQALSLLFRRCSEYVEISEILSDRNELATIFPKNRNKKLGPLQIFLKAKEEQLPALLKFLFMNPKDNVVFEHYTSGQLTGVEKISVEEAWRNCLPWKVTEGTWVKIKPSENNKEIIFKKNQWGNYL